MGKTKPGAIQADHSTSAMDLGRCAKIYPEGSSPRIKLRRAYSGSTEVSKNINETTSQISEQSIRIMNFSETPKNINEKLDLIKDTNLNFKMRLEKILPEKQLR